MREATHGPQDYLLIDWGLTCLMHQDRVGTVVCSCLDSKAGWDGKKAVWRSGVLAGVPRALHFLSFQLCRVPGLSVLHENCSSSQKERQRPQLLLSDWLDQDLKVTGAIRVKTSSRLPTMPKHKV